MSNEGIATPWILTSDELRCTPVAVTVGERFGHIVLDKVVEAFGEVWGRGPENLLCSVGARPPKDPPLGVRGAYNLREEAGFRVAALHVIPMGQGLTNML